MKNEFFIQIIVLKKGVLDEQEKNAQSSDQVIAFYISVTREKLNDREGQPVYTYSSHLVDTAALYMHISGPSIIEIELKILSLF